MAFPWHAVNSQDQAISALGQGVVRARQASVFSMKYKDVYD